MYKFIFGNFTGSWPDRKRVATQGPRIPKVNETSFVISSVTRLLLLGSCKRDVGKAAWSWSVAEGRDVRGVLRNHLVVAANCASRGIRFSSDVDPKDTGASLRWTR